ncbi:MAG: hypothetical protein COZ27_03350 [Candidatus Moranbacteria bacterium CG_4_10_14_3_um_filter_41_65]|nr:MAG: hypothetical protein AUK58_02615 [Candidatus Moranbacteria bacterium CG2_30_41_165]PIP25396.1 MAG: hypothetical protein COX32_03710 [Candidatus Moranbacteria bacterium CG23_combo_of_CG06-09_8_20_14_all_41_28]PIV86022.1 MAG: hypothetical protein COW50_03735 [Candidatus Moranbacteria bacterium CG17_big_fil_post_rev_8_21_14_2_50_41_107]PIX91326.1 MAG: hypothetical protein COZ27_03350 [Candidatus Moranbacteria bacterium CG_4_10_14_3_um_filter_41_65]PJC00427.1 MAG: hypothetical protein CO075
MTENKNTEEFIEEQRRRLEEITKIQFGVLSDDEILRFLAERKRLVMAIADYEKGQREEQERKERLEKERALKIAREKRDTILQNIEKLNQTISPDKKDDELIALISERKALEQELETIDQSFPELVVEDTEKEASPIAVKTSSTEKKKETALKNTVVETLPASEEVSEPVVLLQEEQEVGVQIPEPVSIPKQEERVEEVKPEVKEETSLPVSTLGVADEGLGTEKINTHNIEVGSELVRYVDQLQSNSRSLGEFLQQLPVSAKKNKAFMLKVAEMDPAYAMHYADSFTLKRDEDFNVRIATLKNPRNSGNALSEMLPEFRTSRVVLTAVKQDYRNVKFIQPAMKDYDEILTIAKKGALEKVKSLKDATDIVVLVPKILQQDKAFMEEVEKAKSGSK